MRTRTAPQPPLKPPARITEKVPQAQTKRRKTKTKPPTLKLQPMTTTVMTMTTTTTMGKERRKKGPQSAQSTSRPSRVKVLQLTNMLVMSLIILVESREGNVMGWFQSLRRRVSWARLLVLFQVSVFLGRLDLWVVLIVGSNEVGHFQIVLSGIGIS
jgi:hypothetical protein